MSESFYQLDPEQVLEQLESNRETGLSDAQVRAKLEKYGPNELIERGVKSPWRILLDQFLETMVIVLIIAAVISGFLGDLKDAIAIVAIVILNAFLGFRQEYQAEQAMAALKKMAVPSVRVRRNGHIVEVSARDLVPGDIVLLETGNMVPADCRVIESINLRAQEAALTGESEPVSKRNDRIDKDNVSLGDRRNMVYMGTVISYGRGQAVVTETGMSTELGNIAELMQTAGQEKTPLQVRLDQLGKGLAAAAFVLVVIVFLLGILRGEDPQIMFLTAISIAVAAVPEGLPAVVTIALALGARRMLRRKALIRKLPAVEGLGSVTVICSDKTGTLTENRMTVTVIDVAEHQIDLIEELKRTDQGNVSTPCREVTPATIPDEGQADLLKYFPSMTLLLAGGALCNDAILECDDEAPDDFRLVGDPTEGALVVAAARSGMGQEVLHTILPRVAEIPFDSERKRMTTVHELDDRKIEHQIVDDLVGRFTPHLADGKYIAFTKGAVDGLLERTDRVWVEDHIEPASDEWRGRIDAANARLAENGMRVLGVACRNLDQLPDESDQDRFERDLIFVGLVGMIDPARPEVKDAVATSISAGIRPIMITGDHPLTARYIAKELGISEGEEVVTGSQIETLSDQEIRDLVPRVSVYARVSPEHKLRIVQALQTLGEIVAMTGDGVNDAPALKRADIGVAMGITGTDVSKEAADMVLVNDNFATIVAAVEEGRVIYDNIRKFIKYTLSSNAGEIWVMILAPFLGMPLPLLPLQILWINLVTDGLPGLALGVEKAERNTMSRPPYPPEENVFARGVGRDILLVGGLMGLLSLGVGFWYWMRGIEYWQTMVFTTLTLSEMGYVMAIRSNRDSLFTIGPLTNRALVGAVLLTTILQVAVVYVPFLQNIFETSALPALDLLICFAVSILMFAAVEFQKWVIRNVGR